jgi:hypothetical protein
MTYRRIDESAVAVAATLALALTLDDVLVSDR